MRRTFRQSMPVLCLAAGLLAGGCETTSVASDKQDARVGLRTNLHFHGCDLRIYSKNYVFDTLDIKYQVLGDNNEDIQLTFRPPKVNASFTFSLKVPENASFPEKSKTVTNWDSLKLTLKGFDTDTITLEADSEFWDSGEVAADSSDVFVQPDIRLDVRDDNDVQGNLIVDYMGKRVTFVLDTTHGS